MMWNWWAGDMGWWMVLGGLWMLLFWGMIIWLIVWAFKKVSQAGKAASTNTSTGSALDIAKERYARGEISKAEFDQIKKDLS